ncbi:MAG TPA: hypothetical protein VMZ06_04595, partial [Candidatus Bathyarchaeia archaeon]|nr:hypothetical protein [Candidatus Bathyarchaeia archaeon]
MDTKYSRRYRLASCFLCFATGIFLLLHVCCLDACAESTIPEQAKIAKEQRDAGDKLRATAKNLRTFHWNDTTGIPDFVAADELPSETAKKSAKLEDQAFDFLNEHKTLFKLKDARKEFKIARKTVGPTGFQHLRLEQMYAGLPVFGAGLVVHSDASGSVRAVNGAFLPGIDLDIKPSLTPEETSAIAFPNLDYSSALLEPPILGVFDPRSVNQSGIPTLAYDFRLSVDRYLVDAHTGAILFKYSTTTGLGVLT